MFREQYESNVQLPQNSEDIIHLENLQIDFSNLFNQKEDHDVDLFSLEGEQIYAHKAICSCRSEYFNKMLYLDDISEIQLNFSYKILYCIIQYLYTGKIEIHKDEVMDLLPATEKFGLRRLKISCFEFLLNTVTKDSVCKMIMDCQSKKYEFNTDVLESKCLNYIENNTTEVFEGEEYLKFNEEFMLKLIKSSKINIDEEDLFKALLKWGKKRVNEDKPLKIVLQNLIKYIRFTQLSADFLVSVVKPLNVIPLMVYAEALEYNISPQDAHLSNREEIRGSISKFTWDPSYSAPRMTISNKFLTCTKKGQDSWNQSRMIGNKPISNGIHYWELNIDQLNVLDKSGIVIGITNNPKTSTYSEDIGITMDGECFKMNKTNKVIFNQGDKIGVYVDMNKLTIEFYLNGNQTGYTGTLTKQTYYPVVHIFYQGDAVTLKFSPSPKSE